MSDPINPSYYDSQDGSDIDCLRAQTAMLGVERMVGYHAGNVAKYLWRWERKNGIEDLRKAIKHIEFLVALEQSHERVPGVVRGSGDQSVRGGDAGEGCGVCAIRISAAPEDGVEIPAVGGVDHHGCGEVS